MDLHDREERAFSYFRILQNLIERETYRKIECLRLNGGKEYFSGQLNCYLQKMGLQREFSCRYTPEQNDVAKGKNQSIMELTRATLEEKSMPKFYWAEAIQAAMYIQNWISTTREKVSIHELYFGLKTKLSALGYSEALHMWMCQMRRGRN